MVGEIQASLKLGVYSGVDGVLTGGPSMKPSQMAGGYTSATSWGVWEGGRVGDTVLPGRMAGSERQCTSRGQLRRSCQRLVEAGGGAGENPDAGKRALQDAVAGTVMLGKVTYGKLTAGGAENGSACPAECPITYVVPQPCKVRQKWGRKGAQRGRKVKGGG